MKELTRCFGKPRQLKEGEWPFPQTLYEPECASCDRRLRPGMKAQNVMDTPTQQPCPEYVPREEMGS